MRPTVEFIYDRECPNVDAARAALKKAFDIVGQAPDWQEWDRGSETSPDYARQFGSPTILVDGRDIGGGSASSANSCRVYQVGGQLRGVPTPDMIAAQLATTSSRKNLGGSRSVGALAVVPAIGLSVLPSLACPACWPAYAALMSSLGVGFFNYTDYLLPLTLTALAVSLTAIGVVARQQKRYVLLVGAIVASAIVVLGKFALQSEPVTYLGAAALVGISIWSALPRTTKRNPTCPSCPQT